MDVRRQRNDRSHRQVQFRLRRDMALQLLPIFSFQRHRYPRENGVRNAGFDNSASALEAVPAGGLAAAHEVDVSAPKLTRDPAVWLAESGDWGIEVGGYGLLGTLP